MVLLLYKMSYITEAYLHVFTQPQNQKITNRKGSWGRLFTHIKEKINLVL